MSHPASAGLKDRCLALLDSGAEQVADIQGRTPLYLAALSGDKDVCELLLDRGATHAPDENGWTPLHAATDTGDREVCELLLDRGASVDAPSKNGCTPLHIAAMRGFREVCELLLDRGASIRAHDDSRETPLHLAVEYDAKETCELLLDRGAAHAPQEDGWTPLHHAAWNGSAQICELLLNRGASVHAQTEDARTPLHLAAHVGHREVCELLLDRGATINAQDTCGRTPLFNTVVYWHLEICKLLLNRGATQVADEYGNTPLHIVVDRIDGFCELLTSRGAGLTYGPNKRGQTPLRICFETRNLHAARAILVSDDLAERVESEPFSPDWTRLISSLEEARSLIALRAPHLLAGHRTVPERLETALDLIVWVQLFNPTSAPRRSALQGAVEALRSDMSPEVLEIISVFGDVQEFEHLDDDQMLAVERGRVVRGSLTDVGRCARRGVLMARYGIPEAWFSTSFWEGPSVPCRGEISV